MSSGYFSPISRRSFCQLGAAALTTGLASPLLRADEGGDDQVELSPQTMAMYRQMYRGMEELNGFLQATEFENSAIVQMNYFALSVGGIDAVRDLEDGRGVDPETFAGLYAGYARPEVAEHLNMEYLPGGAVRVIAADGRLRYKGTAVRMYSPDRLSELFRRRDGFRHENESIRQQIFSQYVFTRRLEKGQSTTAGQDFAEVKEMTTRFARLQPLIADLDNALRNERTVSSVMPGDLSYNYFGMSIAGVDSLQDLSTRRSVDPETLAAIYAQRVSPEYAGNLLVDERGIVIYDGAEVKLYSVPHLRRCFALRDRLALLISR
ncbi:MAG: hypothetical protein R3C49_25890 [Planctomycetaceae bacterium]